MIKKIVLRNATLTVFQVITSGVTLFFLYRYLLKTIGLELLGVWSIVLATTMAAKISELGFSGSVVKFVAKYTALNNTQRVSEVIQSATLSVAFFIASVAMITYVPLQHLLEYAVPHSGLGAALAIFPYALISLWLNAIAGVFQSGLDGCQRIDIKSYLMIGGNIFYLIAVFVLVPYFGFLGLAYAQVLQSAALLIFGWMLLRKELPYLPRLFIRWDRSAFLEMWRYAVNFQVNSLAAMLYDPVTKALLGKFGGLSMVGIYEMASRMIMQFRTIVVSANQVLVPAIAGLEESGRDKIPKIYQQSYALLLFITIPYFAAILLAIPFISEIWIGSYDSMFVNFSVMLAVGWFLNLLTAPAYFSYLGIGCLRWNTASHLTTAVLNLALGLTLGHFYGGYGVVAAWVVALVLGSLIVTIAYHMENKLSLALLAPRSVLRLIVASCLGCAGGVYIYAAGKDSIGLGWAAALALAVMAGIVLPVMARHPIASTFKAVMQAKRRI